MTARESLIKDRKKRSGVLSEVRKAEYEEGMEKREREREERMKVKILY
jgi:hypothetical protein